MRKLYGLRGSGVGHAIALALAHTHMDLLLDNYSRRTAHNWVQSEQALSQSLPFQRLPIEKRHPIPCWYQWDRSCEGECDCNWDNLFGARDRIFISTPHNWTDKTWAHTHEWCHTQFERIAEGKSVEPCTYPISKHKLIDRINAHWPSQRVFSADPSQIISAPWIYDAELNPVGVEQLCDSLECEFNWPNAVSLHRAYLQARTR